MTQKTVAAALVAGLVIGGAIGATVGADRLKGLAAGKASSPGTTAPTGADSAADPVVASVNGREIRRSELQAAQAAIPQARQLPFDKIYDQLLEQVITNDLIVAQAETLKLDDGAEVKAAYRAAQQQILARAWVSQQDKKLESEVTDAQIKTHYEELVKAGQVPEEVHAHHILVASEAAAKTVLADLKATPFDDEAKAKSTDPSAKQNAGDLGYFTAGNMVPAFSEAAFKMKPGEITQTPVKTQFGWHIIKVDDRRTMPLDEIKDQVKGDLAQGELTKSIEALKQSATIKRFKSDGSPADAKQPAPEQGKGSN